MAKRPTKDIWMAVMRLRKSAAYLLCRPPMKYGGSIEGDVLAVLLALEKAHPIAAVDPVAAEKAGTSTRDG